MPLWVYVVCLLLSCACAWLWVQERRLRRKFDGLSCYPKLPFIGNLHQLIGDGKLMFQHLDRMSKICEETLSPFVLWLGPCPIIVTHDPDDVKTITTMCVEKPYYYTFARVWLGDGLLTAPASIWKHNIKRLAGTFTSTVVAGYLGVFNAQAHKLVESLKTEVGKEPFDILQKYLAFTTLEAICQTALGVSQISESVVTTEYYEAFNRLLELLMTRGLNMFLHPDVIYRLTPAYKETMKCVATLHHVSDTVLKKRKLEAEDLKNKAKENKKSDNDAKDAPKFKAFLDILLESEPLLSDQQLKNEVDTIILAGQETVATTLSYTLLVLGSKPDVQEKVYAELRSIFGDSKRAVCKEDLSRMEYCEAVIHETLRLYPSIPGFIRYADRDLQLKSCRIPKGTACGINTWGAGRSARAWGGDAALFRPERWLQQPPENPATFLPFSYGRRACIGKKYALGLAKTVLAHCVRELEFESQMDNMQLKIDIALRPVSGHLIQVRLRDHK